MSQTRRLAAIVAADVAGYTRLMGLDEAGTVQALRKYRAAADPFIAEHGGRVVKTTGDGVLIEFGSVVGAVECALALQHLAAERNAAIAAEHRMEWRIGVHLGDVLIEGDDILGDGVNIAARLEGIAEPGGICLSDDAFRQVRGKVEAEFADLGEQSLKNIARPLRVYSVGSLSTAKQPIIPPVALPLPDKPSIAILPFVNMSGDPEQEYFADGMVEEITTAISRLPWLFVIARNSAFTYKGKPVDVKQVAQELGVRYVLEGSVRKAGNRVRITGQLIDTTTGAHIWADRFDGAQKNSMPPVSSGRAWSRKTKTFAHWRRSPEWQCSYTGDNADATTTASCRSLNEQAHGLALAKGGAQTRCCGPNKETPHLNIGSIDLVFYSACSDQYRRRCSGLATL